MTDLTSIEVRTRSTPAAAYLLCLGFEPLGVLVNRDRQKAVRFSPAARNALNDFLAAKVKIDALLAPIRK